MSLGGGRKLTVVQMTGVPHREPTNIIDELIYQARQGGFFDASDRSHENIIVLLNGSTVTVYGGEMGPPQQPDEIGLRLDLFEWGATPEYRIVTETRPDGTIVEREEVRYVADVILAVTAFNVYGRALMAEYEYHTGATAPERHEALYAAGAEAIRQFLKDVTPTITRQFIRIDDEDPDQEPIIEVAQRGNLAYAIDEMRDYVEAHPNNASAHYNLAVLLDASGQYEEALYFYSRAIELNRKDFYVSTRAECARRLADWEALSRP